MNAPIQNITHDGRVPKLLADINTLLRNICVQCLDSAMIPKFLIK